MGVSVVRGFLFALGLWCVTGLAGAQAAPRVAVVIGNAAYQGETPLRNPHNDAALIAQTLKKDLGFDDVLVYKDLTRSRMFDLVRELKNKARSADSVVVYYSGHGMRTAAGNFLIPVDARIAEEDDVRRDAIAASEFAEVLQNSNARVALLILDACRDNPYSRRSKSLTKGLSRMGVSGGNLLVTYATGEGATADDGSGQNSPYAQAVAEALKDSRKSVLEQFDQVRRSVRQSTNNKQNPTREGDLETGVYLVASLAPVAVPVQPVAPIPRPVPVASASVPVVVDALSPGSIIKDCADCPEMVVIPAGRFTMGGGKHADEQPRHEVSVGRFALGKTEVTQGQWRSVMGSNPSHFKACGDDCPVENVNWEDAQAYVRKLSEKTGKVYRLPSEAEWEYACRAGGQGEYCGGDKVDELAWYSGNSGSKAHPVGRKQGNAFGLYDMSGNVWEWVKDCWNDSYQGVPVDGSAWRRGKCVGRVLRGGSWDNNPEGVRAANRYSDDSSIRSNDIGVRPARMLP